MKHLSCAKYWQQHRGCDECSEKWRVVFTESCQSLPLWVGTGFLVTIHKPQKNKTIPLIPSHYLKLSMSNTEPLYCMVSPPEHTCSTCSSLSLMIPHGLASHISNLSSFVVFAMLQHNLSIPLTSLPVYCPEQSPRDSF